MDAERRRTVVNGRRAKAGCSQKIRHCKRIKAGIFPNEAIDYFQNDKFDKYNPFSIILNYKIKK